MAPMIIFDHSKLGNWGAFVEVRSEDLVHLTSLAYILSKSRVFCRSSQIPSPDSPSLIVQGRLESPDFWHFPVEVSGSKDPACLDPDLFSSRVSDLVSVVIIDLLCCLMIPRYIPRVSLISDSGNR